MHPPFLTQLYSFILTLQLDQFLGSRSLHHRHVFTARAIASALASSISAEHSDYLLNNVDYDLDDVLTATDFSSRRITYQATDTDTPALGEIASNVAGTAIIMNYRHDIFKWDYIPRNGDTAAYISENSDSFQY